MLAIKNSAMKNAFDGIINKLDKANERVCEPENI